MWEIKYNEHKNEKKEKEKEKESTRRKYYIFQSTRLTKKLLISESKERGYTRFFHKYADDVSPSTWVPLSGKQVLWTTRSKSMSCAYTTH